MLSILKFKFWIAWVVLNLLGWLIGSFLSSIIVFIPWGHEEPTILDYVDRILIPVVITTIVTGPVAISQLFTLRQLLKNSHTWVLATLIGFNIGVLVAWFVSSSQIEWLAKLPPYILALLVGATIGLSVGITQWLFIRQSCEKAWLWIINSGIAGMLACISIWWISNTPIMRGEIITTISVCSLIFGASFGLFTGAALLFILQRPKVAPQQIH